MLVLDHGELIDREPVVCSRSLKIQHLRLPTPDRAVARAVFHRHTLHDHAVESAVACFQSGALGPGQPAKGIIQCLRGKVRVEPTEGVPQPALQHHLSVVGTLCTQRVRGDVGTVNDLPAEGFEPGKSGVFYSGFGEGGMAQAASSSRAWSRVDHAMGWTS